MFLLYFQVMSSFGKLGLLVLTALSLNFAGGCSPADYDQQDEEREPHFVLGNNRFNAMDYSGAIEAFQQSLEVNPHSAKAHYRLAQLFDTKEPDPAAAIYHYQEYLRLDPMAENRDVITNRINDCKQQLAADVLQLPSAPATVKQIEVLTETNRLLQQRIDQLTQIAQQWKNYYDSQQAQQAQQAAARPSQTSAPGYSPGYMAASQSPDDITTGTATGSTPSPATDSSVRTPASAKPPRTHTHIVAAGETMSSIARKLGISRTALETANPTVSPKHLRVGQTLYLPPDS